MITLHLLLLTFMELNSFIINSDESSIKETINIFEAVDNLAKRRQIYFPSYSIYGGFSGFYDYGPIGSKLLYNIISLWKKIFIYPDNVVEIVSNNMVPYPVLKSSGHVDKFSDVVIQDSVTKKQYRADKYISEYLSNNSKNYTSEQIEQVLNNIEGCSTDMVDKWIDELNITSPNKNKLSKAYEMNLMFNIKTLEDYSNSYFLRPELTQALFANFKRIYDAQGAELPLTMSIIGTAFRNEISARNAFVRLREFQLAEIIHFIDENDNDLTKLDAVSDIVITLLPISSTKPIQIDLLSAFNQGLINNTHICYYIGKTAIFLKQLGIPDKYLRFRQQNQSELAHYSKCCWDVECFVNGAWLEVIGIANRSSHDLRCHQNSNPQIDLQASRPLNPPISENIVKIDLNKDNIINDYKNVANSIFKYFSILNQFSLKDFENEFKTNNKIIVKISEQNIELNNTHIKSFQNQIQQKKEEKFFPTAIEPSFGIGRLFISLLNTVYKQVQGPNGIRTILQFPPKISAYQTSILTVSNNVPNDIFLQVKNVIKEFTFTWDRSSASIGKKYARADEIGIPYSITIDMNSHSDNKVTIRDRDSANQIRIPISIISQVLQEIIDCTESWNKFYVQYAFS